MLIMAVPQEGEVLDGVGVVHVLALVEEARRMVPRVVLAWFVLKSNKLLTNLK
jgi:hypothetical protein